MTLQTIWSTFTKIIDISLVWLMFYYLLKNLKNNVKLVYYHHEKIINEGIYKKENQYTNINDLKNYQVEIKSVNHRYLDISVKMPKVLSYLEEEIKKEIFGK